MRPIVPENIWIWIDHFKRSMTGFPSCETAEIWHFSFHILMSIDGRKEIQNVNIVFGRLIEVTVIGRLIKRVIGSFRKKKWKWKQKNHVLRFRAHQFNFQIECQKTFPFSFIVPNKMDRQKHSKIGEINRFVQMRRMNNKNI